MRWFHLLAVIVALAFAPLRLLSSQQPQTSGVFVDRSGVKHAWQVTSAHSLTWDGKPYIPVGGVFCPRTLAEGQTEQNWEADVRSLGILKSRGIQDIVVNPVISAPQISAAAWQKLVDLLEESGMRYGISFGAGITSPLTGTLVNPASYRHSGVREGSEISWRVLGADTARFVIADGDGTVQQSDDIRITGGKASVTPDTGVLPGSVGLLYPRKTFKGSSDGQLPDIWSSYDSYRDRIIRELGKVKFGQGLRFFLDPLAPHLHIGGEVERMVPDSPGYRLEWEAFLARKYRSVDELLASWAILDREIEEYKHAATLTPLWFHNKGVPYMVDPVKKRLIEMDRNTADQSRFWRDASQFRNESMAYYMNSAADLLKRNIADVPVIYTYTGQHRMFTNFSESGGFDGVGIAAYGSGTALVTGGASAAYSQTEENKKPSWLIVTEMLDAPLNAKTKPGYDSEQAMNRDLDWLRGIGAKGFFLNGFQILPEGGAGNAQLLQVPEQLEWLKRYADRLQAGSVATNRPNTLPYPACAAGLVSEGPIGGGSVWWVPSLTAGRTMEFGSSYAGYTIAMPGGDTVVLWSLTGPRVTRFYVADPRAVQVTTPDGRSVEVKVNLKKRIVTFMMDRNPLLIRGSGDSLLPLEAIDDSLQQLYQLLQEADAAKIPMHEARNSFESALRSNKAERYRLAFLSVVDGLNRAGSALQPYAWIEAESAQKHTFSEAAVSEAASGGGFMLLNTETNPPGEGYSSQYTFSVPRDDLYMIWAAATPPGGESSPFYWTVDAGEPQSSSQAVPVGSTYLHDRLVWLRLGRSRLQKGDHTLTLRVSDRASATAKYYLALDSFIVTRFPFSPAGTAKPPLALLGGKPVVLPDPSKPSRRAR